MDDFELLGLVDDSPPESAVSTEPAAPHSPRPRWWLAVPVALVIGLVVLLSRTDSDPEAEGPSLQDSTDVTEQGPEEGVIGPGANLTREQLVASFDGSVLLTGASGREIVANHLASGDVTPLGITGEPLHFVDGWLVYVQEAAVKVVNLADGAAEPRILLSNEAAGSGFDILIDSGPDVMTATRLSDADGFEAQATAFDIGSWDEATRVDNAVVWHGTGGVVSSLGNGIYELTLDGYQRRGSGIVLGTNRTIVVSWECDVSLADCHTTVRDRGSWEEIGKSESLSADGRENLALAPEGFIVVVLDWLDNSAELFDLEFGVQTEMDTTLLQGQFINRLLGVSDAAVLMISQQHDIYIVDRVTGETSQFQLGDDRAPRRSVLVSASLPYVAERTNAS